MASGGNLDPNLGCYFIHFCNGKDGQFLENIIAPMAIIGDNNYNNLSNKSIDVYEFYEYLYNLFFSQCVS